MLEDDDVVRENLNRLSQLDTYIAIDDFGTGYSSLAHLRDVPFDVLKIDHPFVQGAPDDEKTGAITRSIISLAHSLSLRVVAETVETLPQFDLLVRHNCDLVQGYLTGHPVAPAGFSALLKKAKQEGRVPTKVADASPASA